MQMARNAVVITVFSGLLCLTFSYTFPLKKDLVKWSFKNFYGNHSNKLNDQDAKDIQDPDKLADMKKLAPMVKSVPKRIIKETTQSSENNNNELINNGANSVGDKNKLSDEDFRHYEKLVIMKKYPYLDIKELELKYSPMGKHTRQSMNFVSGESNLCESVDEGPNVEISNRGLSGFGIPPQLAKHVMITEMNTKSLFENPDNKTKNINVHCSRPSPERNVLISLKDDIKEYINKKTIAPLDK